MAFEARTAAIREFGQEVRAVSADSATAANYAQEWLGIGYAEGRMFATVVETADAVREALVRNYNRLGDLTAASADELAKTADHYDKVDARIADALRKHKGTGTHEFPIHGSTAERPGVEK